MATVADLERVIRRVLNEGTAYGQKDWAGTSKATLASIQQLHNLIRQEVIPRLKALPAADGGNVAATMETSVGALPTSAPEPGEEGAAQRDDSTDEENSIGQDAGVQQLAQAATDEERLGVESTLLVETDNGPHGDDEEISQEPEVEHGNS